jgi:hypothetical protein
MFLKSAAIAVEDKIVDVETEDFPEERIVKPIMNRAASSKPAHPSSTSSQRQSIFVASDTMVNGGMWHTETYP